MSYNNVRISASAGNEISLLADGIYAPTETSLVATDTSTIDFTTSGTHGHNLTASVKISADAGNIISAHVDGIYAANAAETPITVQDTASINLTASGTSNHTIQADVNISATACNQVSTVADGLYVAFKPLVNRNVGGNTTLVPATDRVLSVTATATVTLAAPTACEPKDFWIVNITPGNTVTINGGGANVGGAASFTFTGAGVYTTTQGETVHVFYDGSNWVIL